MAAPTIHTYHCLCTSLLLASTHNLNTLPRRAPPSLDNAIIVPLPPAPKPPTSELPSDSEEDDAQESSASKPSRPTKPIHQSTADLTELGYTLLLSTVLDHRPTIVRRSDGFEKRYLLRCGRCKLVVGYELDASHFGNSDAKDDTAMVVDDGLQGGEKKTEFVYLLPGGILSTEAMAAGKKISDQDVVLGESDRAVVAAWE
jgi:hypothetical protein